MPHIYVQRVDKAQWYGVLIVGGSDRKGFSKVQTLCTRKGKTILKRSTVFVKDSNLVVVDDLPESYTGSREPTTPSQPRKFTDSFAMGDIVSITRTRHGWHDGRISGPIVEISDWSCTVLASEWDGSSEYRYQIDKPRDIHLIERANRHQSNRKSKRRRK